MTSLSIVPEPAWESPAGDPGLKMETRDQIDNVSRILDDLSENQQEVVRLRFQGGLSYREISEMTGHTVSNVGFLLHTALKNIRERMQDTVPTSRSEIRRAK